MQDNQTATNYEKHINAIVEMKSQNIGSRKIAKTLEISKSSVNYYYERYLGQQAVQQTRSITKEKQPEIIHDNSTILIISDMHIPYHHQDSLEFLKYIKEKHKPTRVVSVGDECFPENAEIMTERGWMSFGEYHKLAEPCKVMQVNDNLKMELVYPIRKVYNEYSPYLYKMEHKTFTSITTPNHKIVKKNPLTGKLHRREAWDDVGSSSWEVPRTGVYVGGNGWNLLQDEIRFLVAFQADGTFTKGAARFTFSKERKYLRLKEILGKIGIPFNEHQIKRGDYQIYIEVKNTPAYLTKDFGSSLNPLNATIEQLKVFTDEVAFWDASVKKDGKFRYVSTNKDNVEFLHTAATLIGYSARRVFKVEKQKEHHNVPFCLDILPIAEKCTTKSAKKEFIVHNGPTYCVEVPSHMILTRQNGWTSVTGNCDKHSLSYHDHDPDLPSAGDELEISLSHIAELKKLFPVMDILESNHGSLVYRKAKTNGIPRHYLKNYNDVLGVDDKWKWHFDLTITLPNGQYCYFHHGKASEGVRLSQTMGMNAVQGHFHEKFKVDYWGNPVGLFWSMQVGCLVNDKSLAMSYNNANLKRPVLGVGLIVNSLPTLEPMVLNKDGRWIVN